MTAHIELSDGEKLEVVGFWREYFRSGGVGHDPSAFQIEALNDADVRDALMWWHIGGRFTEDDLANDHRWHGIMPLLDALGTPPEPVSSMQALNNMVKLVNDRGIESDDADLGTVFILLHVEWLLLAGDFQQALRELGKIAEVIMLRRTMGDESPHNDPLRAMMMAVVELYIREKGGTPLSDLREVAASVFGMTTDSPAPAFAIKCSDNLRLTNWWNEQKEGKTA